MARKEVRQPFDASIRHIALTQGMVAIVDAADYDWLMQWNWCVRKGGKKGVPYAVRADLGDGSSRQMHRVILGLSRDDPKQGDHINGKTLDNRRGNLRSVSASENCRNRHPTRNRAEFG